MDEIEDKNDLVALTAEIVTAYVSANKIGASEVATLVGTVHSALANAGAPAEPEAPVQEPAVPIRSSIKHDYIVCLEDGKKLKMLKRYLMSKYQMTPDEYRAKWGLPRTYPMVAPAYAETRRGLAIATGLGRKAIGDALDAVEEAVAKPVKKLGIAAAKAAAAAHLTGGAPKKRGRPAKVAASALEQEASEQTEG